VNLYGETPLNRATKENVAELLRQRGGVFKDGIEGGRHAKDVVPLIQPLPHYTEEARKARIEGSLVLQAIVRKNGTIDTFKVLKALGYGLDKSTINTIASKWRFRPAILGNNPVDVFYYFKVSFEWHSSLGAPSNNPVDVITNIKVSGEPPESPRN
jgi:TonB family protein